MSWLKRTVDVMTMALVVITAVDAYMYFTKNYSKPWFIASALSAVLMQAVKGVNLNA